MSLIKAKQLDFIPESKILFDVALNASKSFDPSSLNSGLSEDTTITVTGAEIGDFVMASFSNTLNGIKLLPEVSSANTVTVTFWNSSDVTVNLSSGTLKVRVIKS